LDFVSDSPLHPSQNVMLECSSAAELFKHGVQTDTSFTKQEPRRAGLPDAERGSQTYR
jgi:hypothetical protein